MTKGFVEKIKTKKATIVVVGLGRVGLPTAAVLANLGYDVVGVDIRRELLNRISSLKIDLKEPDLQPIIEKVVKSGKLKTATNIMEAAKTADIVIISVQTPLAKNGKPDVSYLSKACKDLARGLQKRKLVIVESTVPPGTIKNLLVKLFEKESGLKTGKDFWLAYCPERITPGKILQELAKSPRLIGGFDAESTKVASELFRNITKGKLQVTDYATAEVAKLAENTFRDVNIGFANELALICEQVGVDAMEVVRLANTHPRVNIHKPGPGVGGPCLTKDPLLLLHALENSAINSKVILSARKLNDDMPKHAVDLVVRSFQEAGKKVEDSKIVVLGVAYKGETDDASNSPSKEIIRILKSMNAKVWVYDPFCVESFGAKKTTDVKEAVKNADCLVIATDHKRFGELDFQKIKMLMRPPPIMIDGKRMMNPESMERKGFHYYGIGYKS